MNRTDDIRSFGIGFFAAGLGVALLGASVGLAGTFKASAGIIKAGAGIGMVGGSAGIVGVSIKAVSEHFSSAAHKFKLRSALAGAIAGVMLSGFGISNTLELDEPTSPDKTITIEGNCRTTATSFERLDGNRVELEIPKKVLA